jgi:sugar lactone lactonase YvrE
MIRLVMTAVAPGDRRTQSLADALASRLSVACTLTRWFLAEESVYRQSVNGRRPWRPATAEARGTMTKPICIVPAGDWTGEGAVWHAEERALYWVDINRFLIHRFDAQTGNVRNWFFAEPPTALALTDRADTLIVAMASRIILWQPGNDARADFANPERNWPRARLNDGRPDPAGNFWVGSMANNVAKDGSRLAVTETAIGRLFCVHADGSNTVEKTGIGVANTFAWSPDNACFYCGDSSPNTVFVWDYDLRTGRIANERPFFAGFDRGKPDGSAVDRQGYLWNARYGGACLVRVSPDGMVDRIIEMPVAAVTTCTFGGPQLKTLFITTAGAGEGAAKGEQLAGGLFALAVDVPGLPENKFHLSG